MQLPPELPKVVIPRPEEEDSRAPISRKDREGTEQEGAGEDRALDSGGPLPPNGLNVPPPMDFPFPPAPGANLPGLGDPPGQGLDQGLDLDPPPGLPFPGGPLREPGANLRRENYQKFGSSKSATRDPDLPPVPPSILSRQSFGQNSTTNLVSTGVVQRLPFISSERTDPAPTPRFDGNIQQASADIPVSQPKHVIGRAVFAAPAAAGDNIAR